MAQAIGKQNNASERRPTNVGDWSWSGLKSNDILLILDRNRIVDDIRSEHT